MANAEKREKDKKTKTKHKAKNVWLLAINQDVLLDVFKVLYGRRNRESFEVGLINIHEFSFSSCKCKQQ